MTEAVCPRCARPIHDTAYIDRECANGLRRELMDLRRIAGEATITIARLDHITRHGASQPEEGDDGWHKGDDALYPHALLADFDRAERYTAAVMELHTTARHILKERGHRQIPIVRTWGLDCEHGRCARIHAGRTTGVTCPLRLLDHPLVDLATYLADNLDWLRYRAEADELWGGLQAAARQATNVIDRHDRGEMVGLCACGSARYSTDAACSRCGIIDLEHARAALDASMDEAVLTAADAARWVADMGLVTDTTKLRKLIWAWAERGHLKPVDDMPRYRFGDVLARVMASPALRAA